MCRRALVLAPLVIFCRLLFAWSGDPTLNNPVCTAANAQYSPQLISDGSHGAIITWYDLRGGSGFDIYAQRVNSGGTALWGANGAPVCTASGSQGSPEIVSDGAGGAIIAFTDDRGGITAQRMSSDGSMQWSTDGVPISSSSGAVPQLVSDSQGGAVITWQDYRSGNYDIYAQRVNASGVVQWTANGVAICTAANVQQYPQLVSDGSGGAIIVWEDFRSGAKLDIYAQRIDASGTTQWTAQGVGVCTATDNQDGPQLISDGSGGAIVTWQDYRSSVYRVYAQRISSAGAAQWSADGIRVCTEVFGQTSPQLTGDGSGGAIIAWQDSRSAEGVYAQRVSSAGALQWGNYGRAICTATNYQQSPQLVADGSGGAIITWQDLRGGMYDVYTQKVNASGTAQWMADGVPVSTAVNGQLAAQIASDGSAGAIITWEDARTGTRDIYASHITSAGALPITLTHFGAE